MLEDNIAIPAVIAPPNNARPPRNCFFNIFLIMIYATRNAVHPIRNNPCMLERIARPVLAGLSSSIVVAKSNDIFTKRNMV